MLQRIRLVRDCTVRNAARTQRRALRCLSGINIDWARPVVRTRSLLAAPLIECKELTWAWQKQSLIADWRIKVAGVLARALSVSNVDETG